MKKILLVVLVMGVFIMLTGDSVMALEIKSSAFKNNETIPKEYTSQGPDISPPLSWTGAPKEAKAFALICDDPDAPGGNWVHWVIYNIPGNTASLDKAVPPSGVLANGVKQGKNDFGRIGYGGPMPPPGKPHRYFFKLYALDAKLELEPGLIKEELLKRMKAHILKEAQLIGVFKR